MDIRKYFKPVDGSKSVTEFKSKIYKLDDECWIEQHSIPQTLTSMYDFDELWRLHPEEYGSVSYMGKIVKTPRWQQTYLKEYHFSGMMHKALPLPTQLQPFLNWANTIIPKNVFNQVLVNWYANGNHHINSHSDNEKQIVPFSPILSLSLGQERIFRIRQKSTHDIVLDIPMPTNTYVMMCGKMQRNYLHEVPKVTGTKGSSMDKRINITFRVFK
jgi:alkylated DNA repair dioxygenase AlkB